MIDVAEMFRDRERRRRARIAMVRVFAHAKQLQEQWADDISVERSNERARQRMAQHRLGTYAEFEED